MRTLLVKGKHYQLGALTEAGDSVTYWALNASGKKGKTRHGKAGDKLGTIGRSVWDAVAG